MVKGVTFIIFYKVLIYLTQISCVTVVEFFYKKMLTVFDKVMSTFLKECQYI